MLLLDIFTQELPHCHCFYRYESMNDRKASIWTLEETRPGSAQLHKSVMEAEEGSIRWGENLCLAGRENVSICASDP